MKTVTLDKKPVEVLVTELLGGVIDVNEFDLTKATQKEAFDLAVAQQPSILSKVAPQYSEHFLNYAIKKNPKNFIYLTKEQYNPTLAQEYIASRLDELKLSYDSNTSFATQRSMDDKLVFSYSRVADDGEELCYFDNELKVPTALRASYKISLKLMDGVKLINKLDVQIAQLGAAVIKNTIVELVNSTFREFLSDYIAQNKSGYYSLSISYGALRRGFMDSIKKEIAEYGFDVTNFAIIQLAIPQDIQYKLEDQAFKLRQLEAEVEASVALEKKSLESYETKLAIQQKYPEADHSLTEYEKDLALKRYLIKVDKVKTEDIDRSIDLNVTAVETDTELKKKVEQTVEIEPKKDNFYKNLGIGFGIAAALSILLMIAASPVAGIVLLVASAAICGVAAVVHSNHVKAEANAPATFVPQANAGPDAEIPAQAESKDTDDEFSDLSI